MCAPRATMPGAVLPQHSGTPMPPRSRPSTCRCCTPTWSPPPPQPSWGRICPRAWPKPRRGPGCGLPQRFRQRGAQRRDVNGLGIDGQLHLQPVEAAQRVEQRHGLRRRSLAGGRGTAGALFAVAQPDAEPGALARLQAACPHQTGGQILVPPDRGADRGITRKGVRPGHRRVKGEEPAKGMTPQHPPRRIDPQAGFDLGPDRAGEPGQKLLRAARPAVGVMRIGTRCGPRRHGRRIVKGPLAAALPWAGPETPGWPGQWHRLARRYRGAGHRFRRGG